jgi:hypothetical protein
MSEKIYTRLLRLYPSRFRKEYEGEALQLIRDRLRNETGFCKRARLWWDLVMDVFVGLPQTYRNSYAVSEAASLSPNTEGIPCFKVLEQEPLGHASILLGSTLSLAALVAFGFLLSWSVAHLPVPDSHGRTSPIESVMERLNQPTVPDTPTGGAEEASGSTSVGASEQPRPGPGAAANTASLDAVERQRVISGAVANLRQHYFDRDVGQQTADALLAHEKRGDDDAARDGAAFADLLSRQMRDASHDMHLVVEYSQRPMPEGPPAQTAEGLVRFRDAMLQQNCMIRKADILPHDIGYLKLDFFSDTSVCGSKLRSAMTSLNQADAIIVDLRDNTGGFPDAVSLIASYFFDRPEYMYGPRGAPTVDSWTQSPVAGNELADKPVYVLTSGSTWSGAEQFSYDLKVLKRATLVGETTRGGAHAGVFHRIDDHFGIGIPDKKAINPFGKDDWEGIGVEPDIKVKAADALETAVKLAETRVKKK